MDVAGPVYQCLYPVGTKGRVYDGGVWNKCGISSTIETKNAFYSESTFSASRSNRGAICVSWG